MEQANTGLLGKPQTKPFMWAPKEGGESQIKHFEDIKLPRIVDKWGAQSNYFRLDNFWGMIRYFADTYDKSFVYLRIYIGVCSGKVSVRKGMDKKLILIFAPAKEGKNSDLKYYILPQDFDPQDPIVIGVNEKELWTENFIAAKLHETIDPKDTENQYPDTNSPGGKIPSDTRCVTYCAKDILELILVKDYYISQTFRISDHLAGRFGAYPAHGRNKDQKYKNRMLTQFDFLDDDDELFYLDDIPGFMELEDGISKCPNFKLVDNGKLCPVNCP